MDKPIRIQRSRAKGSKQVSPNGLDIVYVGRPSKWGNPFPVGGLFANLTHAQAVEAYKQHAEKWFEEEDLAELRGKNLSCWCPIGTPCHADFLLEIANK